MIQGIEWDLWDTFAAQNMCPYETVARVLPAKLNSAPEATNVWCIQVAYGFSRFCDLFTYEEWEGFDYFIDIAFAGNNAFQSTTGVCSPLPFLDIRKFPPIHVAHD